MKLKHLFLILAAAGFAAATGCNDEEMDGAEALLGLQKALALKENSYVVQKKGEEAQTYSLTQEESRWYIGRSYTDKTKEALKIQIMEEDPELSTVAWGDFELPTEIVNKPTTINEQFVSKFSWSGAKFGIHRSKMMVSLHVGKGGNVILNGKSQILVKERGKSKAYSGEYELIFYCEFTNDDYDQETGEPIKGDEYTIYARAVVNQYFPTLTWFRIEPEKDWVKLNSSVKIDADWDDGAEFDWSKVKLIGSTLGRSYSDDRDEGYFTYDAKNRSLTAIKNGGNSNVYVKFGYEGTDMKSSCQIDTGEGWGYTSFTLGPEYLVMGKYAYLSIWAESYKPTNLTWSNNCLEIDPASDPDENFMYYDGYMMKSGDPKPGDYTIRLQVRSNPSVGYRMPIKVVKEETPSSFKITYKHKNGVFEPFVSGGENGVCNYGMGLELGVITTPEDAYWNWADVELSPGYDETFSFSGVGGRDDHPKLMLKTSHGSTSYGTQVQFRLKYDHRKTAEIYVDHN